MSVEYLGKVNNIVTVEKLKELTGMSIGNYDTGDITWLKFSDNGKELLIASKNIANDMSWNNIDSVNCVFGKLVNINNINYTCRLISGGDGNTNSINYSEWKKFIVDLAPNDSDSNWNGISTYCQETFYNDPVSCVVAGRYSVDSIGRQIKTGYNTSLGWRPILERIDSFEIIGISENFGEITSFNQVKYTVTNLNGGNFNLTEKVDGQVIRTLNNQSNGEFTFNIENFDSLVYGNHAIEIIADDPTATGNVVVTSKFNKIKNPVQPIPTNSNLKQVMLHNKELEKEISYQNFRLSEKLKNRGSSVSEGKSLSSLIDIVDTLGVEISRQNGVASVVSGTSNKINISSVDLSKSICWGCLHGSSVSWSSIKHNMVEFESESSIRLVRKDYNSYDNKCYWEVLEFKSGVRAIYNKKIEGTSLVERDSKDIFHGFDIKNPSKCLIYYSYNSYNGAVGTVSMNINNITNTTINVTCYEKIPGIVNLYVVELL